MDRNTEAVIEKIADENTHDLSKEPCRVCKVPEMIEIISVLDGKEKYMQDWKKLKQYTESKCPNRSCTPYILAMDHICTEWGQ